MAKPSELKAKISLVNPSNIRDAVQLVNRLDGLELDRLREAPPAAATRQSAHYAQKTVVDALHGLSLECDSDSSESDPDITEDPAELMAALSKIGATDIAEVLAASLAQAQKSNDFKCFFCKDSGHTWLRCSKLWDHLKKNGFKARPQANPFRRHRPQYASKSTKPAPAGTQSTKPLPK